MVRERFFDFRFTFYFWFPPQSADSVDIIVLADWPGNKEKTQGRKPTKNHTNKSKTKNNVLKVNVY